MNLNLLVSFDTSKLRHIRRNGSLKDITIVEHPLSPCRSFSLLSFFFACSLSFPFSFSSFPLSSSFSFSSSKCSAHLSIPLHLCFPLRFRAFSLLFVLCRCFSLYYFSFLFLLNYLSLSLIMFLFLYCHLLDPLFASFLYFVSSPFSLCFCFILCLFVSRAKFSRLTGGPSSGE